MVRCTICDLRITWPRPDDTTLARLYQSESYYEERGLGPAVKTEWPNRARGILAELGIRPSSVLDFGAGEGHFVRALRDMGIVVEGIDPSPAAQVAARRLYGIELRRTVSPDLKGRFQLVTLIHSLEHVPDPVGTLTEVATLLEPGGVVFIEVPHAGSIELWRPSWRRRILDLPAHFHHFVPETLTHVVERAGLRVLEIRLSNPAFLEWVLGVRARLSRAPVEADVKPADQDVAANDARQLTQTFWVRGVLPWFRKQFPGYKFQLLATKA